MDYAGGPRGAGTHTVWKIEGKDLLHPIPVKLGITDGVETEVLSGGLKPGDELATGQDSGKAAATATAVRNPMMPLGGRGGRR